MSPEIGAVFYKISGVCWRLVADSIAERSKLSAGFLTASRLSAFLAVFKALHYKAR
jgi:hypothetical protein